MPLILALLADATALDVYAQRTRAEPRCASSPNATDVTVCGLRRADRFRVPFIVRAPGDPRQEAVADERHRYLARTDNCTEKSLFLVGCGSVGVSMTVGGRQPGVSLRPMAK